MYYIKGEKICQGEIDGDLKKIYAAVSKKAVLPR
jgi:hypothetical protein